MANKPYQFIGPLSTAITVPSKKAGAADEEIQLHPGQNYSLPEEHETVRTFLAKEYLKPADAEPAPTVDTVRKKEDANAS